jgi:hypothetical protein
MTTPSYRPFSNGSEFMDWNERNCCRCQLCPPPDHQGPNELCAIENAIALASITGGTFLDPVIGDEAHAKSLAARLGWDPETDLFLPDCPERQPIQP